jgi:SAM-dependent methyltransferase
MGLEVVGIDLSQAMVQAASQLAQAVQVAVQFQVMDAMELRFPEASFDVALYSYNGLELLPGKEGKRRAMQEVHRVLRRGGHFIFCTHSLFALNRFALLRLQSFLKLCAGRLLGLPVREQELGERFCDEEDEEVKYLQVLPPGTLLRMLRECGFAVRYFNTRRRLERGRAWAWPAAFEDGERFYVARKK